MTIFENQPFSALSRQINLLLWGSVVLSTAIALVSFTNIGRLSLFAAPAMFILTVLHNGSILICTARDRRKSSDALAGTLAASAHKASIVLCWTLAALWTLTGALMLVMAVLVMTMGQFKGWQRLVGYVELPLIVLEIGMLVVLAMKCAKQRRVSIIKPYHVDWQHVGA